MLQEKLNYLRRQLKRKRSIIKYLKKQKNKNNTKKINIQEFFNLSQFPSINSKAIMTMQMLHKNRKPWTKEEKKIALSIYYKSPSTYKYMRRHGIVLPGESTVRRWLRSIEYVPGFINDYLNHIKIKVSAMTYTDKKCVILLDEMSILKCIEYNKALDMIEGFEDLGPLGRSPNYAKHALVIMIRGLYKNWKFPLRYFLSGNGVGENELINIIKQSVKQILDIGLLPTSIVCDQGSQNRKLFSLLGGTELNPLCIIHGQSLHLIFDIPHLIKSLRNNLMSGDIQIKNKIISFQDVFKTYNIDSKSNMARGMCKITRIHLNPNPFEKMSCKLAIQIFSNSVSAAIKTCLQTGELISETAKDTAEFLLEINNTFDACNSKHLYDNNPYRKPMSEKNQHIFKQIKKTISTFQNAKKLGVNKKITVPPCFTGMIWSLNALINLYTTEYSDLKNISSKSDCKNFFLLTNRLNQDPLENMFSIMRQKNGYTKNPSARMFRSCFANICSFSLMKASDECNCELDEDEFLSVDVLNDVEVSNQIENCSVNECLQEVTGVVEKDQTSSSFSSEFEEENMGSEKSTLEECSIVYFSGYLVKQCIDHFKCTVCKLTMLTTEKINEAHQILIMNKTFAQIDFFNSNGLKKPSFFIINICKIGLEVSESMFETIQSESGIVDKMMKTVFKKLEKKGIKLEKLECKEHIIYIIKLLFTTRIYKECKWLKEKCVQTSCMFMKQQPKLRILQHK